MPDKMRIVIRLLALRKHDQVSEEQFQEFLDLANTADKLSETLVEYIKELRDNDLLFGFPLKTVKRLFLVVRSFTLLH